MTAIKAIETWYNDILFRSRLEARWAVFLDTLGVKYDYEPQGYEWGTTRYLPDFYIPHLDCFVEIKGQEPTEQEQGKANGLAVGTGKDVYLFAGSITVPHDGGMDAPGAEAYFGGDFWMEKRNREGQWIDSSVLVLGILPRDIVARLIEFESFMHETARDVLNASDCRVNPFFTTKHLKNVLTTQEWEVLQDCNSDMKEQDEWRWLGLRGYGGPDEPYQWCECADCGAMGIEFDGRSDRMECKTYCNECSEIKVGSKIGPCPTHGHQLASGCPKHGSNFDKGYNSASPRLIKAYQAAKSARFEFGQRGAA